MPSATSQSAARARVPAGGLRWLLLRAWCLLLGARLGRALRSALGGCPPAAAGPPVRPRRPKPPRSRRGQPALPYPSAA